MIKGLRFILLLFSVVISTNALAETDLECMSKNIYFEGQNQSFAGQLSIGLVVLNRVKDTRFPNSVCEVIYEGPIKESWRTKVNLSLPDTKRIYYPIRHRCQFSWYCDGKPDEIKDSNTYAKIEYVASLLLDENITVKDITEGATHYHAYYVAPDWGKDHVKILQIDDHIFYRWEKNK
jgi:spore germination cell wall hydrolase CwlJ-like protein